MEGTTFVIKRGGLNQNFSVLILRRLCAFTFLVKAVWRKGDGKWLVGVYVRDKRLAFGLNFCVSRAALCQYFCNIQRDDFEYNFKAKIGTLA